MLNRTTRERHEEDDLLPRGALDPASPRYVPEELRADFIACPRDVERQFAKELHRTGTVTRFVDGTLHQAAPADSSDDFDTALCWDKIRWAAQQVQQRQRQAEQNVETAARYTCPCCGRVVADTLTGRHTQRRRLRDGTDVTVCGDCFEVLDRLAVDRLASTMLPSGRTRSETAADFYERSRR